MRTPERKRTRKMEGSWSTPRSSSTPERGEKRRSPSTCLRECFGKVWDIGVGGRDPPRPRGVSLPPTRKIMSAKEEVEKNIRKAEKEMLEEEEERIRQKEHQKLRGKVQTPIRNYLRQQSTEERRGWGQGERGGEEPGRRAPEASGSASPSLKRGTKKEYPYTSQKNLPKEQVEVEVNEVSKSMKTLFLKGSEKKKLMV